ncbi:hypothetical protein AT15_08980 [Kosmotoga arenicorallina S304]|uniref:Uncharacterized protein n=1 Tax=Kosmotoga arenicorallina S304 TaxID=1453497 RepID=A0A176K264_9BACT|nr:hypothetical protein [Kosmotoga arenicorallina]OAA31099.1 hypothetical protein AT15_08980 [Kosmotoga arenicorallina S304]
MKKVFSLFLFVLLSINCLLALEIYAGKGFEGVEMVSVKNGETTILNSPLNYVKSGIKVGSYLFLAMRNFGFSILEADDLKLRNIVHVGHATDIAINIESLDLLISDGSRGILHYKFFRPDFLKFVEMVPVHGWVVDIDVWKDYLIVATDGFGLYLYKKINGYFQEIDKLGGYELPRSSNDILPSEIFVNKGRIFLASGHKGLMVIRINEDKLVVEESIGIGYAISLDFQQGKLIVADLKGKRVLLFDVSGKLKFIKQFNLTEEPRKVKLIEDPQTEEMFLVIITDSGIHLKNLSTAEDLWIYGIYSDIIKPLIYEP